jgi:hypothetical protein
MTTDELIRSVDEKLALLLLDKEDMKKAIFGDSGKDGLVGDMHEIKKVLTGDPVYKTEGLIEKVNRLDDFHKKMQHTGKMMMFMIAMGGAIGGFITWSIHKIDKIKAVFSFAG